MPDSKISGLTSATTPLAGTEVLPIVQGGQTRQVSVANLTAGRGISVTTLSMSGQLTNTLATGTAPFVITSTTRVSNLNVATAGTADTLTTARNINEVSFNGSANITVPRVRAIDDRTAAPADFTAAYATVGFGSWNNNNTSPYADYIAFRTYTDASGGSDNMVSFRKDAIGMRVWQQTYGSATAFATYKDVAFTDSSITGNAATATALQNTRTLWGQNFNGTANVTGSLTSVGDITGTAGVTLTATAGTLGLVATGANVITASTNGSERMRITSAGDVGVGTNSPATKLDVNGTFAALSTFSTYTGDGLFNANARFSYITTPSAATLRLGYQDDGGGQYNPAIGFRAPATLGTGQTNYSNAIWSTTNGALAFGTGTAGSYSERMRVSSGGDVGIGTSSPGAKLDVAGAARVQGDFFVYGTGDRFNVFPQTAGSGVNLVSTNNANSAYAQLAFDGVPLIFKVAGTERMRIDSSGNLGLGVTPSAWNSTSKAIQISTFVSVSQQANGAANFGFNFYESGANSFTYSTTDEACRFSALTTGGFGWFTAPSGTAGNAISFTQAMTLDAAGNLGLGVTPQAWNANHRVIELAGASSAHVVAYVNGLSSGTNYYINSGGVLTYSYTGQNATRYLQNTTGQHQWFNAPSGTAGNAISFTQAMTLDASGNLGIGTSSPDAKLRVNGTAKIGEGAASNTSKLMVNTVSGVAAGIQLFQDANESWIIQNPASTTALTFANSGTERMRITSTGDVGIGTTSVNSRLQVTNNADSIYQIRTTNSSTGAAARSAILFVNDTGDAGFVGAHGSGTAAGIGFPNATVLQSNLSAGLALVSSNASGPMVFHTGGTGSGNERLRITATGNIHTPAGSTTMTNGFIYIPAAAGAPTGVATAITGTVPLYYNSSANILYAYNSSWQTLIGTGTLPLISSNANGVVYLNSSSQATTSTALQFNGTELGVGQAASAGIQVDVTSTSLTQIRARATTNGVDSRLVSDSSGLLGYTGTISNHPFAVYTNNTERMRITAAGAMQLSPTGGEGGELNLLNSAGGTVGGYVDVSTTDNFRLWTGNLNATMQIGQLASTGGNIQFYTAATERMRITSTGTVGIGTSTTTGAGLDVKNDAGGILVYAYGDTATAGNVSIIARNTDVGAGSLAQFGLWNDQNPFSGFNATLQYYSNASTIPNEFRISQGANAPMTFYTNGSERMRITGGGNFLTTQTLHVTLNTAATLGIADVRAGIIVSTPATNITITLPTGTTLESYTANMPVGFSFELTIILVTGSGGTDITIAANGNTYFGGANVTFNGPATLRFRKTATNTFTVYRIA